MAVATTADAQVLIGAQSAFGSEATTYYKMPFTAESINFVSDTVVSEEITSDRAIKDVIRVATGVEGDIEFELQYHTAIDLIFEGAFGNNYSTNELTEGTSTKYFSIEKNFLAGSTNNRATFIDMAVGGLSIDAEIGALITGSASFLGGTLVGDAFDENSATSGSSVTEGSILSSAETTTSIEIGAANATLTGASPETNVQAFSFAIDNGLRQQRAIGDKNIVGIGLGRFATTGSMTMHFDSQAEMNLFLADTARAIQFQVSDGTRGYIFDFPNVKYTSAEVVAGGVDEDIVVEFEFQALEGTSGHTVKITKDAS